MPQKPMYLFLNPEKGRGMVAAERIFSYFSDASVPVLCEPWLAQRLQGAVATPLAALPKETAALISIGGDGTLLLAAPVAAKNKVPMLGIHTGTIGFLMEADINSLSKTLNALLSGDYFLESRALLSCKMRGARPALALNDCSVTRGEHPGVLSVEVLADGESVYNLTGDGVLISTPTGATAYALAAGASILRPDCSCLLITPLCAREILARPVVVPDSAVITLKVKAQERRKPQYSLDGQLVAPITGDADIIIRRAAVKARFIRFSKQSFFEQLRLKQAYWNHF